MRKAHFSPREKRKKLRCFKCQEKEHYANKCPENKPEKSDSKKSSEGGFKSKEKTFAVHLSSQGITKRLGM